MEDKKYNQQFFNLDIIKIIEEYVQKIAEDHWGDDECSPEFWVSLDNENMNNQSIMITISHLGIKFTEKLFPRKDTEYGYNSISDQMISMYTQTM